ncbi:MAG: MFS transporter [Deltaproteobacteria bacterium]|nr:MFS transporter [Deltaproteobacteria bacterium]MBW1961637.1 MFS transporter [Deltaproteobacteria bacterium]MBW1993483.1 MFS transporter [Deltaproteobacteria bacterium]MBW2151330.1 MFS transporter [Deltaproteobacteria bacterium]
MDLSGPKFSALITATSSSLLVPYMVSSINIALPSIQKDLQADAILLSWVATAYLLSAAVSLVPFGRLGDIYGRKKMFLWGMILFTISSLLCGVAPTIGLFIFFRVFQGIGSSMLFATRMAILSSVFPPAERGFVLGINVAAVYAGVSCGPFFGGLLTQHFTWRSIFLFNVPFCLVIIFLIVYQLKGEWAEAAGESFDFRGSAIYGITLIAIIYGISRLPSFLSVGLILVGIAGFIAFFKWETTVHHPVFEVKLFQTNRVFTFSCLAALINYSATFAVTFMMSLYLQYIKGLTPQTAGIILISQPVMMALVSPMAGRLSDKTEPRIISSVGMAMTAAGLLLLTALGFATSLRFIVPCLSLLGLGFGLFSSPNMNAIMSSVEKKYYGIAAGSVATMRLLGQMFSMGIATLILALFIGRVQIKPENYPLFIQSVNTVFIIFTILCSGGIFLSVSRGKLHK